MHLLVAQPGQIAADGEAIDLDQAPGDVVFLSSAASELALLARAWRDREAAGRGRGSSLRLANLMQLDHNMSVDLYVEKTIARSKLVIVRLMGGVRYWPYGIEQLAAACRENGVKLAVVPGDDAADPELTGYATLGAADCHRLWQYCAQGGAGNFLALLDFADHLLGHEADWLEPVPLLRAGLYWPGSPITDVKSLRAHWRDGAPVAPIVFYRALVQAEDLKPVDALIEALRIRSINPLPIFVSSLKDQACAALVALFLADCDPDVILNTTAFAVTTPGDPGSGTPFSGTDAPVLQVVLAGQDEESWRIDPQGLSPRDLSMNVALPEVDGRVLSRAISFKRAEALEDRVQGAVVRHEPVADRIDFVADLAENWAVLRRTPPAERRVAVIVANYPNRDGRIGNGVGLDTPAGIHAFLTRVAADGYDLGGHVPDDPAAIIGLLLSGPTNANPNVEGAIGLDLPTYLTHWDRLPAGVRRSVEERWGAPENDRFFKDGGFVLGVHRLGNAALGVQPSRGYDVDPLDSYHDPDLAPPHRYFAFYFWLRHVFGAHAAVHFGKHGNMEWLPGKALALSGECYPETVFGPLPHVYPFIVNDPGEGSQAKRRAQAVIVDHLMPPLTRAESYGPLRDLETLVDEYYQAAGMDRRRLAVLRKEILDLSRDLRLDRDAGMIPEDDEDEALGKIDNYLCELKETQIRGGLHVFGRPPDGDLVPDLLVALTRVPRGNGEGEDASLIRALSADLGLADFDPLDCELGEVWDGPRPSPLETGAGVWRSHGDTVERLEHLASSLVSGSRDADPDWRRTRAVLDHIAATLRPAIEDAGEAELTGIMTGLDGRFVPPGPSGAPSRGRLDVLPTGRNFYSVDVRAVPTPTAWTLGWKSASLLIDRYFQDHGEYPARLAISAWGTANMRTGGDDIAQALALMGVQPTWDPQTQRMTGYDIMPLDVLDRPRVDVLFRVSGFFRDAFPTQLELVDSAARAVADLDEPTHLNPIAGQVRSDAEALAAAGYDEGSARRRAGHRVFGSKPGAYGAGLQALIDERLWESDEDLARAYVAWGGYAYGGGSAGEAVPELFASRLSNIEAVVQNQDNREHDILDSDDYYQFEGGMAAAVRHFGGTQPEIYHNDHSRPERPRIRTLRDEIGRVVRARAANPKWIDGIMRHGYKGAFEIAATVDYLFAFAATSRVVEDHHFDQLFDAYLRDERVRSFIEDNNPSALSEIAERFEEAIGRGLWHPRSNAAAALLAGIREESGG
ncbi:MAG: cobaltochelatase subunit CobN [Rhodospirillales bacterium]|nr:cobaltochelatase subunit CobN [Rhodospirillales bacterium]